MAVYCNIYKHDIKYRNILYNNSDYNDNPTIINTNLTTSISIYHFNLDKADTKCAILHFFTNLFFIMCAHLQRSEAKCLTSLSTKMCNVIKITDLCDVFFKIDNGKQTIHN